MKNRILIFLFFFLSAYCASSSEPGREQQVQKETLDIPYAVLSEAQKLDIFLPSAGDGPYPVLIWIHGGGWKAGNKADFQGNNQKKVELLSRGYAVVSINYRLSGEAKFPAQIHDVKAAIRWVKANSSKYRLNPDKVGIWGHSAGGHLSALAGTSGGVADLEDLSLGNSNYTSYVQAVVDWFGPIDLLSQDKMAAAQGCHPSNRNTLNSAESQLIGHLISERPDLVAAANPITYITNNDPPFFIEHGLEDCGVPYGQSQLFYDNLLPVLGSGKVKIKFLPGTGHDGGLFSDNATVKDVVDFLDVYLK